MFREFTSNARTMGSPVTVAIVILLAGSFLVGWLSEGRWMGSELAFFPVDVAVRPWTLVSYPLGNIGNFLGVLFSCLWLWGIGGTVERDIGSRAFAIFWLAMSALGALFFWVGYIVLGEQAGLFGPYVPIAATTVVWGTRYPELQVMLMFVLCIKAKYVAWISVGLVFFGSYSPRLALFAIAPLAIAYLYASNKIPGLAYGRSTSGGSGGGVKAGRGRMVSKQYLDDVKKREKERDERERLRRLFENSLDDKPDDDR